MAYQQIYPQYNARATTESQRGSASGAIGDFLEGIGKLSLDANKQRVAQDLAIREEQLGYNKLNLDAKKAADNAKYQESLASYQTGLLSKLQRDEATAKSGRQQFYNMAQGIADSDVSAITSDHTRDYDKKPLTKHEEVMLNAQGVLGGTDEMTESTYSKYLKTIGETTDSTVQYDKKKNRYFKNIVSTGTGEVVDSVTVQDPLAASKLAAAARSKTATVTLDAGAAVRWARNKLNEDILGGKKFTTQKDAQDAYDGYLNTALANQKNKKFTAFDKNLGEPVSINGVAKETGSTISQYGQNMTVTGNNTVRVNDDNKVSGATFQSLIDGEADGALKDALSGFDTNVGLKNFSGQKDYNMMLDLTGSKDSSDAWMKEMARNASIRTGGFPSFFARMPMVKTFMAGISGEKPKESQVYSFYRGLAELNAQGRLVVHKDRDSKVDTTGRAVRSVTAYNLDGSEMTNSDIIKYGNVGTTEKESQTKFNRAMESTSQNVLQYD